MYYPSNTSNISRWTYYMLVFLAGFMPFEDFILKFLPGPDELYFASRFVSELMILAAFGWMVFHRIAQRAPLLHTPVDAPVLVLIVASVVGLSLNLVDPLRDVLSGILNVRPIFRYILLFYVIVNTPLSTRQVNTILTVVLISGFFQVMLGLAQFVLGGTLDPLLMPRESGIEVGGEQRISRIAQGSREIGAIHGPASDTVFYALSMNILFVVCIAKFRAGLFGFQDRFRRDLPADVVERRKVVTKNDLLLAGFLPLIILADMLTYVRASLAIILLILVMELFFWLGRKFTLSLAGGVFGLLMLSLVLFPPNWAGGGSTETASNPIEDMTAVFTVAYFMNNLENQRLHQLVAITPTVLTNRPFFGWGPNEDYVVEVLNQAEPKFLNRDIIDQEFQDVYWVALLAKFGIVGLSAMVAIFYILFRSARLIHEQTSMLVLKELSLMTMYTIIFASIILFFNRSFELRIFGFYFWLIPGLMFNVVNHYQLPELSQPAADRR